MNEKNVNMKGKEEPSPHEPKFKALALLDSWIIILPCFKSLLYFHTAWKEVKSSEWFATVHAEEHGLK